MIKIEKFKDHQFLSKMCDENGWILDQHTEILRGVETYSKRQVLAWGCGSGKTSKLAVNCAFTSRPTLVVLSTNEEVDRLVQLVKALNSSCSIIGLHSNNEELINKVNQDHNYLKQYKVLVTNSYRFFNTAKTILFSVNNDSLIREILGKSTQNREVVFFDEFPKLYSSYSTTMKDMYFALGVSFMKMKYSPDLSLGRFNYASDQFMRHINYCLNDSEFLRNALGVEYVPDNSNFLLRRSYQEKVGKLLDLFLEDPEDFDKGSKSLSIMETIETIVPDNAKVIILDATADILFNTSKKWEIDTKYPSNAKVEKVTPLDLKATRNKRSNSNLSDDEFMALINEDIQTLDNYLKAYPDRKHFIVTWKTINDDKIDYIQYLKDKLTSKNYMITHYGSGKTRATNEFISCDSIIFFGDWAMNRGNVETLNIVSNSDMSATDYLLAEYTQAVFRTCARLKDSKPILIAFGYGYSSDDFDIVDLKDRLLVRITTDYEVAIWLNKCLRVAKHNLTKPTFDKVKKFIDHFNIDRPVTDPISVSIAELKEILDTTRTAKGVKQFKPVVLALKDYFNITLNISTIN